MSRWGNEMPPDEAYSRVTNPERFQPLHDVALSIIERLEADFDVERVEGYGIDEELEKRPMVRLTVKLIPINPDAAPLVVAFSDFPGIHVRAGRWCIDHFPVCGCDACDETADGEIAKLTDLVEDVTAGRFIESVNLPPHEYFAGVYWALWKDGVRFRGSGVRITQDRTRQWEPWPLRKTR